MACTYAVLTAAARVCGVAGSSSSQDEQGVAAYKTVELDDKLNGKPGIM